MLNRGRILVVDDTPANLEVMSEILAEVGYTVATAIDGERALKRVQTHPPELILLDVQMPGIDGFETCHRLKSNAVTVDIPVIFITALSDTESKVKGFELGAVDYITKPFQEREVLARIGTHLQLHRLKDRLEEQVTERTLALTDALEQLERSQLQLIQNEKMSALGNLVAGVAHEINNPLSCIVGNLSAVGMYMGDLLRLVDSYAKLLPQANAELEDLLVEIDLDYLRQDFPKLLATMKDGGERIKTISNSLRIFSRSDSPVQQLFNLHDGLDSTILILGHRLKANEVRREIKIIKDYGLLPEIKGFPGQINQVFMNLLANAIDAVEELNRGRSRDEIKANPSWIRIRTNVEGEWVQIAIADNGIGIPPDQTEKIFERLFTTKAAGEGTGLGLAIAKAIVVDKHGGKLEVHSELGKGTEFYVRLPLQTS